MIARFVCLFVWIGLSLEGGGCGEQKEKKKGRRNFFFGISILRMLQQNYDCGSSGFILLIL